MLHLVAKDCKLASLTSFHLHDSYLICSIVTTPLFFAAQEGHFTALQYLHQKGKCDLASRSFDGMSPIHAACQSGHLEIMQVTRMYSNITITIVILCSTLPVNLGSQQHLTKLLKEVHHCTLLLVSVLLYEFIHCMFGGFL